MGRRWHAVLGRIGTPTGDRRIIAPGALTTRDLPLPLMWQRMSGEGHGGAVTVATIEELTIDNSAGVVTGSGRILDVRGAADAERQMEAGVTGPSLDLFDDIDITEVQKVIEAGVVGPDIMNNFDDVEYVIDEAGIVVITSARIAGATLVQIPAFADVYITLEDADVSRETFDRPCDPATEDCSPITNYALVASVRSAGWSDMPLADETRDWDGDAAAGRVFSWATDGDTTDWGRYARAFLWHSDDISLSASSTLMSCHCGNSKTNASAGAGNGHTQDGAGIGMPVTSGIGNNTELTHLDRAQTVGTTFGTHTTGNAPRHDVQTVGHRTPAGVDGDGPMNGSFGTRGPLTQTSNGSGNSNRASVQSAPPRSYGGVQMVPTRELPLTTATEQGSCADCSATGVTGLSGFSTMTRSVFAMQRDISNGPTKADFKFPIADVIDGTLTIVPRGVFAAAAAVQGARTGSEPAEADAMRSVLNGIYARLDREPPWGGMQASASVSRETLPPLEWFARPGFDGPTPLTVTDEGRVFGHIAPWGTCHVGLPGCTTAPPSFTNYAHFLRKHQETSDGTRVPTGIITVGGGHADPKLGMIPAMGHYDNPDWATAKVFAGEDEFGIWVAGWILPYADPVKVQQLKDIDVSGDWRMAGGNLEMMGLAAVVEPGFPVLRRVHFSLERGGQQTLIGQFKVTPRSNVSRETLPATDDARARWHWATREV